MSINLVARYIADRLLCVNESTNNGLWYIADILLCVKEQRTAWHYKNLLQFVMTAVIAGENSSLVWFWFGHFHVSTITAIQAAVTDLSPYQWTDPGSHSPVFPNGYQCGLKYQIHGKAVYTRIHCTNSRWWLVHGWVTHKEDHHCLWTDFIANNRCDYHIIIIISCSLN